MQKNIFGEPLETCSKSPMTGYFRNGCCDFDETDSGAHTVCVVMTREFLIFSRQMGNDLITPMPMYQFPGLQPGDRWCLCALRWIEAWKAGKAPFIIPEATHEQILEHISLEELIHFAYKESQTI